LTVEKFIVAMTSFYAIVRDELLVAFCFCFWVWLCAKGCEHVIVQTV